MGKAQMGDWNMRLAPSFKSGQQIEDASSTSEEINVPTLSVQTRFPRPRDEVKNGSSQEREGYALTSLFMGDPFPRPAKCGSVRHRRWSPRALAKTGPLSWREEYGRNAFRVRPENDFIFLPLQSAGGKLCFALKGLVGANLISDVKSVQFGGGIDFDPSVCHAFFPMTSLRQTGPGMFSARARRGRPWACRKAISYQSMERET